MKVFIELIKPIVRVFFPFDPDDPAVEYLFVTVYAVIIIFFPPYLYILGRKIKTRRSGKSVNFYIIAIYFIIILYIISYDVYLNPPYGNHDLSNVSVIYGVQKSYKKENGAYAQSPHLFSKLEMRPPFRDRYDYYCDEECIGDCDADMPDRDSVDWPYYVRPMADDNKWICLAVSNIDDDPALDVWMIDHENNKKHVYIDKHDKLLVGPNAEKYNFMEKFERYRARGKLGAHCSLFFAFLIIFHLLIFFYELTRVIIRRHR